MPEKNLDSSPLHRNLWDNCLAKDFGALSYVCFCLFEGSFIRIPRDLDTMFWDPRGPRAHFRTVSLALALGICVGKLEVGLRSFIEWL